MRLACLDPDPDISGFQDRCAVAVPCRALARFWCTRRWPVGAWRGNGGDEGVFSSLLTKSRPFLKPSDSGTRSSLAGSRGASGARVDASETVSQGGGISGGQVVGPHRATAVPTGSFIFLGRNCCHERLQTSSCRTLPVEPRQREYETALVECQGVKRMSAGGQENRRSGASTQVSEGAPQPEQHSATRVVMPVG